MTTASAPEPVPFTSADQYVGDRIALEMRRRRMTQTETADALSLGQSSLSKKLNGDRGWSLDELLAASRYFSIPVSELLPGAEYQPRTRMRTVPDAEIPGPREEDRGSSYGIRDSNPEPADLETVAVVIQLGERTTGRILGGETPAPWPQSSPSNPGSPAPTTPEVTVAKVIDLRNPRGAATVTPSHTQLAQQLAVVLMHPTATIERSA